MMNRLISYTVYGVIYAVSLLPLRILYLFSDIMWLLFMLFPPLRYRKRVVRKNLRNSFPEKDVRELRHVERRFYRNLFDILMESVKAFSISPKTAAKRMKFKGLEPLVEEMDRGCGVMVYAGHLANWEWLAQVSLVLPPNHVACMVYHPLENSLADSLARRGRERLGAELVPMNQILRRMARHTKEGRSMLVGMIADQTPIYQNIHLWTEFLSQNTPVFTGSERLAERFSMSTYFANVKRVGRGHYLCEITPLTPSDTTCEYPVTREYFRMLESAIKADPSAWLWSHNRWKRTYTKWLEYRKERG